MCSGGGIGIAGSADIVIAADDAYFGVPEIDRGGMGMGAHLQRMFSLQKVRYMYFTGDTIDAAEAYRLGAVERVVQRAELRPGGPGDRGTDSGQVAPDDLASPSGRSTAWRTAASRTSTAGSRGSPSRPT